MIPVAVPDAEAVDRVASLVGRPARLERAVLYPYYVYRVRLGLPALAGRRETTACCLVDACAGRAATAEPFEVVDGGIDGALVLDDVIDEAAACENATAFLRHTVGRRWRTLGDFGIRLAAEGRVHKAYWIVTAGAQRVLVDSGCGAVHPLDPVPSPRCT